MGSQFTLEELRNMRGSPVYSSEGEKVGAVEEIFVDQETRRPEWMGIGTGFLKTKRVLVPVRGATTQSDGLQVPYQQDRIKEAPNIDDEDRIGQETEESLYSHYGLQYSERRSDTGLPEGETAEQGTTPQEGLTRHEEELQVGKRPVDRGRVRLVKWVETEPAEADVELREETAHVERERIDRPVSGADLGEQEVEMPLRGEEPVVRKEAVAKEQVKASKDEDTRRERISEEVRKEHVEVEDEDVDVER